MWNHSTIHDGETTNNDDLINHNGVFSIHYKRLTKLENKISNIIGKDLKKNDIYFSGIDFIDQKLNGDINVTSPTGLKSFYDLTNINLAKVFWKGLRT